MMRTQGSYLSASLNSTSMHAAAQDWAEMSHASGRAEDFRNTAQAAAARSDVDTDGDSDAVKRAARCLHKLDHDISHLLTKLSVLSTADMSAMARGKSGSMLLREFCETTAVLAHLCAVDTPPVQPDQSMAGCSTTSASSARTTLAEILERDTCVRDSDDVIEDSDREPSTTDSVSGTTLQGTPRGSIPRGFSGSNIVIGERAPHLEDFKCVGTMENDSSVERVGVVDMSTGTTIRVLGGLDGRKLSPSALASGRAVLQPGDPLDLDVQAMRAGENSYLHKLASSEGTNKPLVGASRLPYMSYWMHARAI